MLKKHTIPSVAIRLQQAMYSRYLWGSLFTIMSIFLLTSCAKEDNPNSPTSDRDNFVASWQCQETSTRYGVSSFDVHILADSLNISNILFENIYNLGFKYKTYAIINGNNFRIPSQAVSGNIIEGSEMLQTLNILDMKYTVNDGVSVDTVTSRLTKQ